MAKPTRFTPKKSAHGWRLNIPPKFSTTGSRQQLFYPTQAKALAAAADLKLKVQEHGTNARAIAPSIAEQAVACVKLLEPLGVSLLEAVRAYVEIQNRERASVPLSEAIAEFRKSKRGLSPSQATAYRLRGEKLTAVFGDRNMATVNGEELLKHLQSTTGGPGAFNQALRLVRTIWRWAAKPPRKWCDTEAVQYLEKEDAGSGEIGILTAAEARTLMSAAEKYFPDTVAAFAIGLFTGMRAAEIARLRPEDVTHEGITVPAASAKTKRRRFINMSPALFAWLEAYPVTDHVCPPNFERKQKAVRRLAGWRVWSDIVPELDLEPKMTAEPSEDLPEWPSNALRHTAATAAVATGKLLETLIFEHGHSGGVETLRRHYVGRMPKAEAIAIMSIGPNGTKIQSIQAA